MHVLMCEPLCRGFEHSRFNAALVRTVQSAYPGAYIRFLGEHAHIEHVRGVLAWYDADRKVQWEDMPVPERSAHNWRRLPGEFPWCRRLARLARALHPRVIIVCAVANTTLLMLKLTMFKEGIRTPTLALPHSSLGMLLEGMPRRPWNWLVDIRNVLALPNPSSLRLVALGGSVYASILELDIAREEDWVVLEDPYLWPSVSASYVGKGMPERIRFGYFGMAMRGFELFSRLADDISAEFPRAEFHLVGFVPPGLSDVAFSRNIRGLTDRPLSLDEFLRRANTLTYAVGTRDPEYYRLMSSVTFIDALACLRPGIYLRNRYVEYYFGIMGDIGYLCDDYDELREVVRGICREFPCDRYQQQVVNILEGRHLFEPANAGRQLRGIVHDCERAARTGRAGGFDRERSDVVSTGRQLGRG